jgi:hypothetical protein
MKHHAEQLMTDVDPDRAAGRAGQRRLKYALRWTLVIFCLAVWIAVAAFFIW